MHKKSMIKFILSASAKHERSNYASIEKLSRRNIKIQSYVHRGIFIKICPKGKELPYF